MVKLFENRASKPFLEGKKYTFLTHMHSKISKRFSFSVFFCGKHDMFVVTEALLERGMETEIKKEITSEQ